MMSYPVKLEDLNTNLSFTTDEEILDDELIDNNIFSGQGEIDKSILSIPIISYDIGEPKNININFQYNFFTLNENNVNLTDASQENIVASNTSQMLYEKNNKAIGKIPRFVRVDFVKPDGIDVLSQYSSVTLQALNSEAFVFEGASSSKYYTGLEIFDLDIETYIYNKFFWMQENNGLNYNLSQHQSANNMAENLYSNSDQTIDIDSKKALIEALMSSKTKGTIVTGNDFSPEEIQKAKKAIKCRDINFSIKSNNFFISDLFKRAIRHPVHSFSNEIKSSIPMTNAVKSAALNNLDAGTISENELSHAVAAVELLSDQDVQLEDNDYSIKIAGYLVKKYEIKKDGSLIQYSNFKLFKDQNYFIDKNVRYNGLYIYKIHTICEVIAPIVSYDNSNQNEYKYFKFLLVSEGRSAHIKCEENISPPPPTNVKARYDYQTKYPIVSWQFPVNPQRDTTGFQIFKRETINDPFVLCAEYDFNPLEVTPTKPEIAQNKNYYKMNIAKLYYIDTKYTYGSNPIYAIASVDAHGMTSNLSSQIMFNYNKYTNRTKLTLISRENAPKPYPNLYLEKDVFIDAIKTSNYERMTVFFNPEYYQVFKNNEPPDPKHPNKGYEIDQQFLATSKDLSNYKIHIVNLDLQKDRTVNIKVTDNHKSLLERLENEENNINEENV